VLVLPLAVHVAQRQGTPVVDEPFVQRQLARANRIFAPYDIAFRVTERRKLPAEHARMQTRADRSALGAHVLPGVLNCFFVASLRDVDEPDRMRQGVHWRSRSHAPAHFVIVSAAAIDDVLAHELGHFLGNPRHSETPGNLMSYTRGEVLPFLDSGQLRRMRRRLRRYLREGELEPLPAQPRGDPPKKPKSGPAADTAVGSGDGTPPSPP
jgi:hypothetical protein